MNKGKIPVEKRPLLNNVGLFLSARKKLINNFIKITLSNISIENLLKNSNTYPTT